MRHKAALNRRYMNLNPKGPEKNSKFQEEEAHLRVAYSLIKTIAFENVA